MVVSCAALREAVRERLDNLKRTQSWETCTLNAEQDRTARMHLPYAHDKVVVSNPLLVTVTCQYVHVTDSEH